MQLLPKTVSISAPDRVRVTHTNDKVIEELAKLDVDTRLELNYDIMKANRERRKKNLAHAQNSSRPEGSPMASLITIATADLETIRKNPTRFEALKRFFTDPLFLWFEQRNKRDKERKSREAEDPDRAEDERRKSYILPPIVEVQRNQTSTNDPSFCHELHEAGRHFQIPLSLFTNSRLAYISANAHGLKKIKVSRTGKPTVVVLDLASLLTHFGIDPKDPLDGLSFNDFRQAGRNLWCFECERDGTPDGSGTRSTWTRNHFGFWDSKPDAELMYKYWKPKEWKLREERYTYSLAFDLQDYREEWSQTKSAADIDAKLEALRSGYLANTASSSKPAAAATLSSSSDLSSARGKVDPPLAALAVGSGDTALAIVDQGSSYGQFSAMGNFALRTTSPDESVSLSTPMGRRANNARTMKSAPSVVVNPTMPLLGNAKSNPPSENFNDLAFSPFLAYTNFFDSIAVADLVALAPPGRQSVEEIPPMHISKKS
ncbi:hypothetical protein BT96DRAFT_973589 [Gymnopus androsaceus JB14]|uniref:Uncharacterized protein n=1 Tax=Gymnopus androsaceus JB14 TaxID=1447944 RepID=A0A6A4I309_9AGAR|nr:hypothetical protein BT96DRAFT_973589 [Gymnopus androsaceus JB14]